MSEQYSNGLQLPSDTMHRTVMVKKSTVRFEASLDTPAYELIFPIAAMPIMPFKAVFVMLLVGRSVRFRD